MKILVLSFTAVLLLCGEVNRINVELVELQLEFRRNKIIISCKFQIFCVNKVFSIVVND
jgi:hypothetical protein